jgi:hypothetical protein
MRATLPSLGKMSDVKGSCAVCGERALPGARMSKVVIDGRTLALCRSHAATVAVAMPDTFEDMRRLFVGLRLEIDTAIHMNPPLAQERRSPIPRRASDDRRVFPPRIEGRRAGRGRRATDPLD